VDAHGDYIVVPNPTKYPGQIDTLNAEQRAYVEGYTEIKREMERHLPKNKRDLYLAPQFRNSTYDILTNEGWKGVKTAALQGYDGIVINESDVWGLTGDEGRTVVQLPDGTIVKQIPIFGQIRLDDMKRLDTDASKTLRMYSVEVAKFEKLNQAVDILELIKLRAGEREVVQRAGGASGIKLVQKVFSRGTTHTEPVVKKAKYGTNIYSAM